MSLSSTVDSRTARSQKVRPSGFGLLALTVLAATMTSSVNTVTTPRLAQQEQITAARETPAFTQETQQPAIAFAEPAAPVIKFHVDDKYYDSLRARMKWVDVRMGDNMLKTPDLTSRLLLTQAAAKKAGLEEVGLNFRDVYGIIYSETSWIPRMGSSKDGTPNLGIAQFEPATARALGLRNPDDAVEAVHVAALHLKQAAAWSAKRISKLKLSSEERAAKLREGISIYYNLSTKGRSVWNGLNTAKLPIETQRHISNARRGAKEADKLYTELAAQLESVRNRTQGASTFTASLSN